MPYPLTAVWDPDLTGLYWTTIETSQADPAEGLICEVGVCATGWDYEPWGWERWLVRPVIRNWLTEMTPERGLLYKRNGLIDALGGPTRPVALTDTRFGYSVNDVMNKKLAAWWQKHQPRQLVPVIAGPHATLTLGWLRKYAKTFASTVVHPVGYDTYGIVRSAGADFGMPDPCPDEPSGRAIPDLYRSLCGVRQLFGLPPVEFPERFVTPPADLPGWWDPEA